MAVMCVHVQLCLSLCNSMDFSVHGIFQARILEWVAISYSRGSSQIRDRTSVSCICRWILYHCTTWEVISNSGSIMRLHPRKNVVCEWPTGPVKHMLFIRMAHGCQRPQVRTQSFMAVTYRSDQQLGFLGLLF